MNDYIGNLSGRWLLAKITALSLVHLDPHLTQNPPGNVLRFSDDILK